MSILVITTITGTLRARAIPKCSLNLSQRLQHLSCHGVPYLLIPISPLFAATMSRQ